jgi:hypothetical protein
MKTRNLVIVASMLCFVFALASCGGSSAKKTGGTTVPEYVVLDNPQVDLSEFEKDDDGYIIIFDGKSLNGWRGYGREDVPGKWEIDEEGLLKFSGSGGGEAQTKDGGDLIFGHKFKNFEVSIDWKVSKGANSGIFYLAQEIQSKNAEGELQLEPIYISAPESQVLDNENHPDAKATENGNRQSSSLYDMIPAVPQNANPFGEWNNTTITVYRGSVFHFQNGVKVLEYHLWTKEWTDMLNNSKFSKEKWQLAFELLNNCGGENHEGYIGIQDHGDDVWFRNIKIKILD